MFYGDLARPERANILFACANIYSAILLSADLVRGANAFLSEIR